MDTRNRAKSTLRARCRIVGAFPDCGDLKPIREAAEDTTDALKAAVYERALSPAERGEFVDLTAQAAALLPPLG